jgi:hypothetical protein
MEHNALKKVNKIRTLGTPGPPRVPSVECESAHSLNLGAVPQEAAVSFPTGTNLMPTFQTASVLGPVIFECLCTSRTRGCRDVEVDGMGRLSFRLAILFDFRPPISNSFSYLCFLSFYFLLFFIVLSGVRLSPLGIAATTGLFYQPQMIDDR